MNIILNRFDQEIEETKRKLESTASTTEANRLKRELDGKCGKDMFIVSWLLNQCDGRSFAEVANRVIREKKWFDILPFKNETTNRPVNKYDDDDDVVKSVQVSIQIEPSSHITYTSHKRRSSPVAFSGLYQAVSGYREL